MRILAFKWVDDIYFGRNPVDDKAYILSSFFTDDVGSRGRSFIEFMNDSEDWETIRNSSCVMKENEDVLIGCQFDEDPYEDCVRMSREGFISILNQWSELVKQRPQEIIVYKEGESYRLEGHGFPDKQE